MGLLNPALIGLLGLGSIPVIIHLLNRRRYQVVKWPAMAFLLQAQVKTRQRLRMENLLLLLVRTLAVLLFAFAATRPFLASAGALQALGPDRRHLYVLVDNSASMGYQEGISTLLQRAVREAESVIDGGLRSDDPVTVVAACDEFRRRNGRPVALLRGTRDHGKVKEILERLAREPSSARMDPAAALAEVAAVAEPGDPHRVLLVLSDFCQADWAPVGEEAAETAAAGKGPDAPPGAAAAVRAQLDRLERLGFDLGGAFRFLANPDPEDVALLGLDTADGRPPSEGQPTAFEVVVGNNGPTAVEVGVRLVVDGREIGTQRVALRGRPARSPGPETGRASFPWTGPAGSHYAEAEVTAPGNRLAADDLRGHAFVVRERLRVVLADGGRSTGEGDFTMGRFVETALSLPRGPAPCDTRVVPLDDLGRTDLEGQDVVVLSNPDRVPDAAWDRIGTFVRRGGGLLVFLGDRADAPLWNAACRRPGIEDLLPARIAGERRLDEANPVSVDLSESKHPALKDLTDPRQGTAFAPPLVAGWWPVREPLEDGVEVLLRLQDLARSPFLLERHHGRGRVLLCTSSTDARWEEVSLLLAPLVQECVGYLAAARLPRADLLVHESLVAEVPAAGRGFSVSVEPSARGDRGRVKDVVNDLEPAAAPESEGPAAPRQLLFPDTARPGRYTVRWKEPSGARGASAELLPAVRDYAVNLDPRECDLARLRTAALEERLQKKGLGGATGGSEETMRERERDAARGDLTGLVLALGAALVVLEMFLASLFGRRRR